MKLDLFPEKIFPTEEFVYGENTQQKNVYILDENNSLVYPVNHDVEKMLESNPLILNHEEDYSYVDRKSTKDGVFVVSKNNIGSYKGVTFVS